MLSMTENEKLLQFYYYLEKVLAEAWNRTTSLRLHVITRDDLMMMMFDESNTIKYNDFLQILTEQSI